MCTWQDLPVFFSQWAEPVNIESQNSRTGGRSFTAQCNECKYLEASRLIVVQCLLPLYLVFLLLKVDLVVLSGYYLMVAQILMMYFL